MFAKEDLLKMVNKEKNEIIGNEENDLLDFISFIF
jgi:hypothetical protein